MSVLPILAYPDPALKKMCLPVETVDESLQTLIDDMLETMYQAPGIGLAAPQVGRGLRLVVLDVPLGEQERTGPLALINPRIVEREGTTSIDEGCLSLPGLNCPVPRSLKVKVEALDREGKAITLEAENLFAICLQHELDHLDGKLFVDYLSPLKRALYKKRRLRELNEDA